MYCVMCGSFSKSFLCNFHMKILTFNSHQIAKKKKYFAAGRMRKFLPHPHSGNTTFFYFGLNNKVFVSQEIDFTKFVKHTQQPFYL